MAGFSSERVAGFDSECVAGFVGIRNLSSERPLLLLDGLVVSDEGAFDEGGFACQRHALIC